ncbi:MAG TPA: glycosyltransferase family 39 protein [bacterium]|nr:glycosyltransferase family 39 protein [bacterium]
MTTGERNTRMAALAVFLFCAALRVFMLDARVFNIDEAFSFTISRLSPSDILRASAAENHPPLFYLLLHPFSSIGASPTVLRVIPALAGCAAGALLYTVGKRVAGPAIALSAFILYSLSPFSVNIAQELRYGTLAGLAFMLVIFVESRMAERRVFSGIAALGAAAALLAYSFYIGILCLAGMTIYIAVEAVAVGSRRRAAARWFAAMFFSLLLFLPWLGSLSGQTSRQLEFVGFHSLTEHLSTFPVGGLFKVFWEFTGTHFLPGVHALQWFWFALWSAAALAGLIRLFRDRLIRLWFSAAVFSILLNWLLMLLFGLYFFPKYHFMLAPMFYLCVAAGLERAFRGRATLVASALLPAFALFFYYSSARNEPDTRDVIRQLNATVSSRDVIILNPPYLSNLFDAFYEGEARVISAPDSYDPLKPYVSIPHLSIDDLERIAVDVQGSENIYAFYGLGTRTRVDPEGSMLNLLKHEFVEAENTQFHITNLSAEPEGLLLKFVKE